MNLFVDALSCARRHCGGASTFGASLVALAVSWRRRLLMRTTFLGIGHYY